MKFGDIVIAVASLAVALLFLEFILGLMLIPTIGLYWGTTVNTIISIFLSGLIVGALFSKNIWEETGKTPIAKIIVLGGLLMIFYYAAALPAQGDWTPAVKETYQSANSGTTLSTTEWLIVELRALSEEIAINVSLGIALGFIGLYVGSMLRKPEKSQK